MLDTQYLLWVAARDDMPSAKADAVIKDPANHLWFSVASLWEIAAKRGAGFDVDPGMLRAGLLRAGYQELAVEGRHVLALALVPVLHRDPFDRLLIAQAATEGMRFLTADDRLAGHGGPVLCL